MSTEKRLEDGSRSLDTREAVKIADEQLLAQLGYKQEFQRAFSPLEVRLPRSFQHEVVLKFYQSASV